MKKATISACVIDRKNLTDDLMIIKLEPSQPFIFKPGQYCTIGVGGSERPYSIVSAPHEPHLELFLELVPKQFETAESLTPRLWKLTVGDSVALRPSAKGLFTLDPQCKTHIMIATVTGIAPFVSMVRAYQAGYYKNVITPQFFVFQGASYQNEFGYVDELAAPNQEWFLHYIPTVSRPNEELNKGWSGVTGRVNLILDEYFSRFGILADKTTICYLCGNEGMVSFLGNKKPESPLGKLIEKGLTVKEEVFF